MALFGLIKKKNKDKTNSNLGPVLLKASEEAKRTGGYVSRTNPSIPEAYKGTAEEIQKTGNTDVSLNKPTDIIKDKSSINEALNNGGGGRLRNSNPIQSNNQQANNQFSQDIRENARQQQINQANLRRYNLPGNLREEPSKSRLVNYTRLLTREPTTQERNNYTSWKNVQDIDTSPYKKTSSTYTPKEILDKEKVLIERVKEILKDEGVVQAEKFLNRREIISNISNKAFNEISKLIKIERAVEGAVKTEGKKNVNQVLNSPTGLFFKSEVNKQVENNVKNILFAGSVINKGYNAIKGPVKEEVSNSINRNVGRAILIDKKVINPFINYTTPIINKVVDRKLNDISNNYNALKSGADFLYTKASPILKRQSENNVKNILFMGGAIKKGYDIVEKPVKEELLKAANKNVNRAILINEKVINPSISYAKPRIINQSSNYINNKINDPVFNFLGKINAMSLGLFAEQPILKIQRESRQAREKNQSSFNVYGVNLSTYPTKGEVYNTYKGIMDLSGKGYSDIGRTFYITPREGGYWKPSEGLLNVNSEFIPVTKEQEEKSAEEFGKGVSKFIDTGFYFTPVKTAEIGLGASESVFLPKENKLPQQPQNLIQFVGEEPSDSFYLVTAGALNYNKGLNFLRDVKVGLTRKELPVSSLVPKEVLSGEKTFLESSAYGYKGSPSGKTKQLFDFRIFSKKDYGYHASPNPINSEVIQAGSSEFPGLYIAPDVSPYFLKLNKNEQPVLSLFAEKTNPAVLQVGVNKFTMKNLGKEGEAFVPGVKPEIEAVLSEGTTGKLIKGEYYFKYGGRNVPIDLFKPNGGGITGKAVLRDIYPSYSLTSSSKSVLPSENLFPIISASSSNKGSQASETILIKDEPLKEVYSNNKSYSFSNPSNSGNSKIWSSNKKSSGNYSSKQSDIISSLSQVSQPSSPTSSLNESSKRSSLKDYLKKLSYNNYRSKEKRSKGSYKLRIPFSFKSSIKSDSNKIKEPESFSVFGRRFGKFKLLGETKEKQKAENILKDFLKGSLGASGKIKRNNVELGFKELGFGNEYTQGKKDSSLIVQKNKFRLGTNPEVKEIQYFKNSKGSNKQKQVNWFS